MPLLLKGFVLGFAIAAPIGPIGLLCIRRTLTDGQASGLISGLGAVTADASYGLIAASSLMSIALSLFGWRTIGDTDEAADTERASLA